MFCHFSDNQNKVFKKLDELSSERGLAFILLLAIILCDLNVDEKLEINASKKMK